MSSPNWQPIIGFPSLQWAETHEAGTVLVRDTRNCDSETLVSGHEEFAKWVADHSTREAYWPIGDLLKDVKQRLGFDETSAAARRRALYNSLIPRPR